MFGMGYQEMLVVLLVVLVLFGGAKIPELMRGVGKGVAELKNGIEEGKRSLDEAMRDDDKR
jgi:sec-independent protein translocase protein TatA